LRNKHKSQHFLFICRIITKINWHLVRGYYLPLLNNFEMMFMANPGNEFHVIIRFRSPRLRSLPTASLISIARHNSIFRHANLSSRKASSVSRWYSSISCSSIQIPFFTDSFNIWPSCLHTGYSSDASFDAPPIHEIHWHQSIYQLCFCFCLLKNLWFLHQFKHREIIYGKNSLKYRLKYLKI